MGGIEVSTASVRKIIGTPAARMRSAPRAAALYQPPAGNQQKVPLVPLHSLAPAPSASLDLHIQEEDPADAALLTARLSRSVTTLREPKVEIETKPAYPKTGLSKPTSE